MRIPYNSANSSDFHRSRLLQDYYRQQLGGGLPYFVGSKIQQRGHGIGSFFANLFRNAIPLIKRGLGLVGKTALNTGLDVATDVIRQGKSLRESAEQRLPEGIKRLQTDLPLITQSGSGRRRIRRKRKAVDSLLSAAPQKRRRRLARRSKKGRKSSNKRKSRKNRKKKRKSRVQHKYADILS